MAKPRPTALDRRITELEQAIAEARARHEATHASYRKQLAQKNEQHGKEMEVEYQRRQQLDARNMVLQSDRDRLTATIEVLARRLASPLSETDPSRAGWRSENRLSPVEQAMNKYRRDDLEKG